MPINQENLGPAERIIQSVLAYADHAVHNRPGLVTKDARHTVGVRWEFVTHRMEKDQKVVYRLKKVGKKTVEERAGILEPDGNVYAEKDGVVVRPLRLVGEYRKPGLFPEVVTWLYRQVAEVWRLDNEFAARWASYQYALEHKDLKVVLAAFMLVQSRKGDPVVENGAFQFYDDDFRAIGEAMILNYTGKKDAKELNPKLLLRIRDVLEVPGVVEINRELGFGRSAREPVLGRRWAKAVHKWLRYREENPKLLEGLVKAGFRSTVMSLCSRSGYRPTSPAFFKALRWKQRQAKDGRRGLAIGEAVAAAVTWEGLTEEQVCERIMKERPNYKRIVGLVPSGVGITRAIMAAAIEAGSLSDKDLIMATPTIEDLGLMNVQEVRERWEKAIRRADDMRAANIATRVKSAATKEVLEAAADKALKAATEEVMKAMRVFVYVDRSGSMEPAIAAAIRLLTKLLPAFPPDRLHTAYFNTTGMEVTFKAPSAAGVEQAFRGVTASGGTDYGSGIRALMHHKPSAEEDVLYIFVGDQQSLNFDAEIRRANQRPMAFGFVYTPGSDGAHHKAVEQTAAALGIPCFRIDEKTFEDTYAIPRTIRNLVAATPVSAVARAATVPRVSLAETILKTELLKKPAWAA